MTDKQRTSINYIMDNFNFIHVAATMALLEWQWAVRGTDDMEIPEEPTIRAAARELLECACEEQCGMSTGGFYVDYNPKTQDLRLRFVVDECRTGDMEDE